MQTYNGIGLRESLEGMETGKLDELLQAELEKGVPDPDSVRLIMGILEERETEYPSGNTPAEEAAWRQYRERMAGLQKKPAVNRRWLAVAASIVLIVGMLVTVVPQQAGAESFWEMLQRWSESVMEFFSGQDSFRDPEYVFKTDNPGLQQVYDAAVELGVTEPVVPMWLPEEYELTELEFQDTPVLKGVWAWFTFGDSQIIYKLDVYGGEPAHQYYKDDSYHESYERNGMLYNITRNHDLWIVVCTKDNIECFLTLDCQEDTFRRILESIYVMEDD